tara:strand:- start:92 stop:289 length:198 start_codon:yes stop_codon:yes gene_type:complete
MPNVSEFERNKPRETYKAFMSVKDKYESLIKDTVVMDAEDATKVSMANSFLKDLKDIFDKFKAGE